MYGPVLAGPLVTLRPPDEEDAERFVAWLADAPSTRYLANRFPPPIEIEREWLKKTSESPNDVFWVIEAAGRPVGTAAISDIDWVDARASTGTFIGEPDARGRGYGSEAIALRTAYAFLELNLNKLTAGVIAENEHSLRALRHSGYREVGIERRHLWREGSWHDRWIGEVLRDDWERQRGEVR